MRGVESKSYCCDRFGTKPALFMGNTKGEGVLTPSFGETSILKFSCLRLSLIWIQDPSPSSKSSVKSNRGLFQILLPSWIRLWGALEGSWADSMLHSPSGFDSNPAFIFKEMMSRITIARTILEFCTYCTLLDSSLVLGETGKWTTQIPSIFFKYENRCNGSHNTND